MTGSGVQIHITLLRIINQSRVNMKNLLTLFLLSLLIIVTTSCDKSEGFGELGGSQSSIGEVGNTFQISSIAGLSGLSAEVTDLTDGVSTVTYTTSVNNQSYTNMIKSMTGVSVSGTSVQRESKYIISTNGIASVYPEGNLTLVDYGAKVGDVYTLKRGSTTMKREVEAVSSEDDFFWGGMMIKTIDVKETGRNIPGVSHIIFRFNHKFGLVNLVVYFEDGTYQGGLIFSDNNN